MPTMSYTPGQRGPLTIYCLGVECQNEGPGLWKATTVEGIQVTVHLERSGWTVVLRTGLRGGHEVKSQGLASLHERNPVALLERAALWASTLLLRKVVAL